MEPHRHDEGLLTRALERCRRRLQHDGELQRVEPDDAARAWLSADGLGSLGCLTLACELYASRPCFGERAFAALDGRLVWRNELRYLTYAELWARVRSLATGIAELGVLDPGSLVGLCGFAGVDWMVADLACLYLAAVSVPLQTTATPAELGGIVAEAGLAVVACSLPQLDLVAATLARAPTVRCLVVMDVHEEDRAEAEALALARQRIEEDRGTTVAVLTMAEVERLGRERAPVPPVEPASPDALRTIVYTSGSTGSPKGAMFPERIWSLYWRRPFMGDLPTIPHVSVDYMPLNHMAGRGAIIRSLMDGGVTTFVGKSDMSTLFEDIRLARPTMLFLVPRVASMIHQHFQTDVLARGVAAAEVMKEMARSFLGDRLVYLVTGTAPTAPEVLAFLERCFQVPVFEGYGSTEAGSISMDGRIDRENVAAFELVDVPELGYLGTDLPHPRGELCLRAQRVIPGYYKRPDATDELLDARGTLHTGDIVERHGRDEVVWVDRKKNVLKLAQGEFVSVSRLEEQYVAGSPFIRQMFLHGSSLWPYLLAVVVPEGTTDKANLRREINRVAAQEGMRAFEVPRDFLVETDPFTQQDGLLTESNKPSRPRLRARYEARLARLHAAIEQRQIDDLAALSRAREGSPAEKVARALAATLGLPEEELRRSEQSFPELGGDSLGAVRVAALIEDLCGVSVPVGLVLDPTSSIRGLQRFVEERLAGKADRPTATFASVHGAGAEVVRAEDLRLDKFLAADEITSAAAAATLGPACVVLLTGANGFLGRFLLLELLERAPRPSGKVVALVRAPSDAAARERLAASYLGADPTLPARFAALADDGRLEVLAGDLIQPRLGLSPERWDRLAGEVSAIVHNGALVNHAFSYAQLFEPNVLGTVEVIRLALRRRVARVSFVSSVGVAAGLGRTTPVREDEDAASLWRRRPIDSGYAVGYGTSKWADEILLRDLEARSGVPVTVFRCSMMLPPRGFVGQVNAGDFLTRLLHGVIVTGLSPRSFYAEGDGPRPFDGLPVDFVARSIAAVTQDDPRPGYGICHVVNGHASGPSLDTWIDWVKQAGYHVERIDDYATWLRRFREKLAALGPLEQHRSPLPILHQWARPLRGELVFDNRRLAERLAAIAGPVAIPDVDALFVEQYLKNMVYAGLIGRPGLSAAA